MAAPVIGTITEVIPSTGLRTREKYELVFPLTGSFTNALYPYSTQVIPGFTNGIGVTIDGEITQDATVLTSPEASVTKYTQPGFYGRDATVSTVNVDQDKVLLLGTYSGHFRCSFPTDGMWYRRLVVTDAGGTTKSAWGAVGVAPGANRGFVRVSPSDSRYFAYEDGSHCVGQGIAFETSGIDRSWPIRTEQSDYPTLSDNGLQVIRFSPGDQFGLWGAPNHPWRCTTTGARHDFMGIADTVTRYGDTWIVPPAYTDGFAWVMETTASPRTSNPCADLVLGWLPGGHACEASTTYKFRVTYGIPVPLVAASGALSHGLVLKMGGPTSVLTSPGTGTLISPYATAATTLGTLEGAFTTSAGQNFLPALHIVFENCQALPNSSGSYVPANNQLAFIYKTEIVKDLGSGLEGPNICPRPTPDLHRYVDERETHLVDRILDGLERYDLLMRMSVHPAGCWNQVHTADDGTLVGPHDRQRDTQYGPNDATMTKNRFGQRAWERYVQARWGYSRAIMLYQSLTEGDDGFGTPPDPRYINFTQLMAAHMKTFAPNLHPTGPSFAQHNIPWAACGADRPLYPDLEYVAHHSYQQNPTETNNVRVARPGQTATFPFPTTSTLTDTALSTTLFSSRLRTPQCNIAMPVIRGELGTWGGVQTGLASWARDRQGIWWHKMIWAQLEPGMDHMLGNWYYGEHLESNPRTLPVTRRYTEFVSRLNLPAGGYVDAVATSSSGTLRVIGQKHLTAGRCHLWLDNSTHTAGNVMAGTAPTAITSATVTVTGFSPYSAFVANWFDTYTGQWFASRPIRADAVGTIRFTLTRPLSTDVAMAIEPATATQPALMASAGGGR